jgi:hypothetical protein
MVDSQEKLDYPDYRKDLMRKRSSRIPWDFKKKNKITDDFKEKLKEFLPELSRNNHYIAFLHDRITMEFRIQLKIMQDHAAICGESEEMPDLVDHLFPLSSNKMQFLRIFKEADDPVYKSDMDEYRNWFVNDYRPDPETFFKLTKDFYSKKKSWVVQKILSLSEDFVEKLKEISEEKGIPLPSLHNMYVLMTGINDFCPINDFYPSQENPTPAYHQYRVSASCCRVPVSVAPDQRDDLIIRVWNRIYNLLVESYWVVIVVGMEDFLNIVDIFRKKGLEKARVYLMHSVISDELKRRVKQIDNIGDLHFYLLDEFSIFKSFFPDFSEFVKQAVIPIVAKREKVLGLPITPLNGPKDEKKFDDPEAKMIKYLRRQELLELMRKCRERKPKPKPENSHSDREEITKPPREIPVLTESKVIEGFEKKMGATGLLKTYRRKGRGPDKMINYLFKILSNISLTINDKIYSKKLREFYGDGMSSVTWRRRKREIREGKIQLPDHPDRPSGVRSINDLFEAEVRDIMRHTAGRKKHHKEGYLSQNQLIGMFQNDVFRSGLNKRMGIELKKYSRTGLRNILNKLIEENRVPFEKFGAANLFKITDIPKIAKEIANFYSRNDS